MTDTISECGFKLGQSVLVRPNKRLGDWENVPLWIVELHLSPSGGIFVDVSDEWPHRQGSVTTDFDADDLMVAP